LNFFEPSEKKSNFTMVFIVVVDGLIASGKSSVLRLLSSKYGYLVEQQRVSDWTLLKPFYENPKLYAEPLQYQILESYHKIWQNYQEGSNKKIGKATLLVNL
jgi:deoxyadenosine/deoxycytidine kinase